MSVESVVEKSSVPEKSSRLDGDSRQLVTIVIWLTATLAAISFFAGVPGLYTVGVWSGLPGVMPALVPLMLDGGLVIFGLIAIVRRARRETARFAWMMLTILTLLSVTSQVAHVIAAAGMSIRLETVIGAVVAAAFPAVVFAATHSLLDLAIAPAPKKSGRKASTSHQAAPVASRTSTPVRTTVTATSSPMGPLPTNVTALAKPESHSDDNLIEWVRAELAHGRPLTGSRVGAFLGVSERTGRNRLNDLKDAQPDLFVDRELVRGVEA